jgi:hypothetical protein
MPTRALDLPTNTPWKLIAASPDMMDTVFCSKLFPLAWRSALALSVYEPPVEDLPESLRSQRLAYLKITCSITGYQPSKEETDQIVSSFPDQPTATQRAALDRILSDYFDCYGALLNVAVFPGPRKVWREVTIDCAALPDARPDAEVPNPLEIGGVRFVAEGVPANRFVDSFPPGGDGRAELHLHRRLAIEFAPGMSVGKVQAQVVHTSEAGVTMEAFRSGVSVGSKWSGHDQNTVHSLVVDEDGIDRVVFTAPHHQASLLEFKYEVAAGETSDTKGIPLDDFPRIIAEPGARDHGQGGRVTETTVSVYHAGTNRAAFLMLPRPDVQQSSDFGSFVQDLPAIEGIQECFLIVSRPKGMEGLSVETWLETGNFPGNTQIKEPPLEYSESFEDFPVAETAASGVFSKGCKTIDAQYTVGTGWVIDRRPERGHDPGHPGLKMIEDRSNDVANGSLHDDSYLPSSDATVSVKGEICGRRNPFAAAANFDRTYRVFTRSAQPKPGHQQPSADVERLLITARELCVGFRSKGNGPEVVLRPARRIPRADRAIVDEPFIRMNKALLSRDAPAAARGPAMKAFLKQVEQAMANSWRLPTRYPLGQVGFLDSEFFKERIQPLVPPELLQRTVASVPDLPKLVRAFGERATVADILDLDLTQLARKAGITVEQAGDLRQRLLRIHPGDAGGRKRLGT